MWNEQQLLPPPQVLQSSNINGAQPRLSKSAPCSPLKPLLAKRTPPPARADSFHVIHKVPVGDTPYVKAKHVQLVDKEPNRAIALFWAAINAGDRVDSALKDMAIVMKQQNRPEEAIEAIKSFRFRCSDHAQESLDNVLLDLYKRCGRLDDQIALLKHKLHLIHQGLAFNGRRTKTARSQGKKFQVSIEQEATRLLGNLGWAYMQQANYVAAEAVYRKALSIEPDNNKVCNLGICLMKQGRLKAAKAMLRSVKPASGDGPWGSDSHLKSYERAQQMLREMEEGGGADSTHHNSSTTGVGIPDEEPPLLSTSWGMWNSQNPLTDADFSGALFATAGFGPSQRPPLPPSAAPPSPLSHPPLVRSNSTSVNTNRWVKEDEEQGFPNENAANKGQLEILQKQHEKMVMGSKEPAEGVALPAPSGRPILCSLSEANSRVLNISAPPFVGKSSSLPKCSASSLAPTAGANARTDFMPVNLDTANHQQAKNSMAGRPSHQLVVPDRNNPISGMVRKKLSFSHGVGDGNKADSPAENNSSPDAWARLGFIQGDSSSPLCTIASALRKKLQDKHPTDMDDESSQRRLPVFLDMTELPSPEPSSIVAA